MTRWHWVIFVLFITGCSRGMEDLHDFVDEVKSRKEAPVEPIPEFRQPEIYTYRSKAEGLRDPFIVVVQRSEPEVLPTVGGVRPDAMRRKEELEAFSLDTLRMVGTVERDSSRWGLVRNKEGVIYRVKPGNYMGRNHGRITAVENDRIELIEIVPDQAGGYTEQPTTVAIGE